MVCRCSFCGQGCNSALHLPQLPARYIRAALRMTFEMWTTRPLSLGALCAPFCSAWCLQDSVHQRCRRVRDARPSEVCGSEGNLRRIMTGIRDAMNETHSSSARDSSGTSQCKWLLSRAWAASRFSKPPRPGLACKCQLGNRVSGINERVGAGWIFG